MSNFKQGLQTENISVPGTYAFEIADLEFAPDEYNSLPLFVAVNRGCNMQCWYCTEHGENRSIERGRLQGKELMNAISAAYEAGIRTFRFTGGEPTLLPALGEMMRATQSLGDGVRVALTTNGTALAKLAPTLEQLRAPSVFISIDSYDDMREETGQYGIKLDKWLSPELRFVIEHIPDNVQLRINCVLTAANKDQLPKLIDYAIERQIDIKIFELLLRDYFYAAGQTSREAFTNQYVSIQELLPWLREEYGEPSVYAGTGGRGMPMFAFKAGNSQIVCFDSIVGSHYGVVCNSCPAYPCQEGLYGLTLDSNGVLHPSGCTNRRTYINITRSNRAERVKAYKRIVSMISGATFRQDVPEILTSITTSSARNEQNGLA